MPAAATMATAAAAAANGSAHQPPIWLIERSGPDEVDLVDPVPGPLRADGPLDPRRQLVVGLAGAHRRAQVELVGGEQARAELAVGGEAHPVAVAAERLGDLGMTPTVPRPSR